MREAPEPFHWHSFENSKLRCTKCGKIVNAGSCDLHLLICESDNNE